MTKNTDSYLYKYELDIDKVYQKSPTNALYTPFADMKNHLLTMDWNPNYEYHKVPQSREILDWFFEREKFFLNLFSSYDWCPSVKKIDNLNRLIMLETPFKTINYLIYKKYNLTKICPDWKKQIKNIIQDIESKNCYKITLYPQCFTLNIDTGRIQAIDFYSCVQECDRFIPLEKIKSIISKTSKYRFEKSKKGNFIDGRLLYQITLEKHLDKVWHENPFYE